MKEINLRDFYPWYMEDVMVEVTEEVAEELLAGQRYIKASRRRVYRNKAHFSLDAEDGIEYSACFSNPSPQELIERMERFEYPLSCDRPNIQSQPPSFIRKKVLTMYEEWSNNACRGYVIKAMENCGFKSKDIRQVLTELYEVFDFCAVEEAAHYYENWQA